MKRGTLNDRHLHPVANEADDVPVSSAAAATYVDPRGSFVFPEPTGFDGSLDDYLDFFLEEPVDDDVLRRVRTAYAEAYQRQVARQAAGGIPVHVHVPACTERIAEMVDGSVSDPFDFSDDAVACWVSGPTLSPLETRAIVRSLQMLRCRSILAAREDELRLEAFRVNDGQFGTYQIWVMLHAWEWFEEAMY